MMEDMGYFCIDNLPIQLLDKLIDFSNTFHSDVSKVAVGIDVRNGAGIDEIPPTLEQLRKKNFPYEILFLDAEDEVLVKRYKETRRNHPLAGSERINKGIVLEREKLQYLKDNADYIIDTSQLLTRELKIELEKIFVQNEDYKNLFITILSGKHGWKERENIYPHQASSGISTTIRPPGTSISLTTAFRAGIISCLACPFREAT